MRKVYIILLTLLFCACHNQKKEIIEEKGLSFETIGELQNIGLPLRMLFVNDTLLINDFHGDSLVHVVDPKNGKVVKRILAKGNGPNEVINPIEIFIWKDSLGVFSRPVGQLYITSSFNDINLRNVNKLPGVVSNVFPLFDDNLVASGFAMRFGDSQLDDKRYLLFNKNGELIETFGSFPKFNEAEKNYSDEELSHFHQTNRILPINDNEMVAVGGYDISFYRKDENGSWIEKNMVLTAPYDYEVIPGNETFSTTTKLKENQVRRISDANLWNDYVIVCRPYELSPSPNTSIRFEVYNLNGELKAILKPDMNIKAPFAISPNGEIYSLIEDENKTELVKSKVIPLQ